MNNVNEPAAPTLGGLHSGLTKLEEFTKVAMVGILSNPTNNMNPESVAKVAINQAIITLSALSKAVTYDERAAWKTEVLELHATINRLKVMLGVARDAYIAEYSDGETDCVTPYDDYTASPASHLVATQMDAVKHFASKLDPEISWTYDELQVAAAHYQGGQV